MDLSVVVQGSAVFLACFFFHVLVWRIKRPVNDGAFLICLFLFLPAVFIPLFAALRQPYQPEDIGSAMLLHYALVAAYISSYPAAQAHSPSLDIFLILASASRNTMTGEEIAKHYRDRDIVIDRIEDLRIHGLVSKVGRHYRLKPAATLIVWLYRSYRRLLGLEFGEG